MSAPSIRSQELARKPEISEIVYKCEIVGEKVKITASTLAPLEIFAKLDDFVDVVVCYVESPAKFYVQLKDNVAGDMKRKMDAIYAGPAASKALNNPQRGQCCAVKFTDGLWYRGIIIDRKSPTQLEVYLVDHGNREKVMKSNVRELHPECSVLPAQAIECRLQNVPDGGDANLLKKFRDIAHNQEMVIRPVIMDGSALLVSMYKVVGEEDFCVNDYLLGKVSVPQSQNPSAQSRDMSGNRGVPENDQTTGNFGRDAGGNVREGARPHCQADFRGPGLGDHSTGADDSARNNFGSSGFRGGRGADRGGRGYYGSFRGGGFGGGFNLDNNGGGFRSGSFGGDNRAYGNREQIGYDRGGNRFGGDRNNNVRPAGFSRGGFRTCDFSNNQGVSGQGENPNTSSNASAVATSSASAVPKTCTSPSAVFRKPALNVNSTLSGNVIQAKSPFDFWITTARSSGFNKLPDAMWQYSKQNSFAPLADVRPNQACIFLSDPPSGGYPIYCRAIIINVKEKMCELFLVDYAETKHSIPADKLFEVPTEFAVMDRQAVKCSLAQAEELRAQFNDEAKKKVFVDALNRNNISATIKGLQPNGTAMVDVSFGDGHRSLKEVCKKLAEGDLNAFGDC